MQNISDNRNFLKSWDWDKWSVTETDQRKKVTAPPLQKDYSGTAEKVYLF